MLVNTQRPDLWYVHVDDTSLYRSLVPFYVVHAGPRKPSRRVFDSQEFLKHVQCVRSNNF